MSSKNQQTINIRSGRTESKQYLKTHYDIIDALLAHKGLKIDGLGFYEAFKRFINRKDFKNENEVNYTQQWLKAKFNISNDKYYRLLKELYNVGLLDVEKSYEVKFFINIDGVKKGNKPFTQEVIRFSSLSNICLNNIAGRIREFLTDEFKQFGLENIKIISCKPGTTYVVHEYPPLEFWEKDKKLVAYRAWDEDLGNLSNDSDDISLEKINADTPISENRKDPISENRKDPISENRNLNIINILLNNLIELLNYSNQSIKKKDGLREISQKEIKEFQEIIKSSEIEFIQDPSKIDAVLLALKEMYFSESFRTKDNINIPATILRQDLKKINYVILDHALTNYEEQSKRQEIKSPVNYLKACIYSAIHSTNFDIYTQINHEEIENFMINEINENTVKVEHKDSILIRFENTEFYPGLKKISETVNDISFENYFEKIQDFKKKERTLRVNVLDEFTAKCLDLMHKQVILTNFQELGINHIEFSVSNLSEE